MPLKFPQESVNRLDLPHLLINIWSYADHSLHDKKWCPCKRYFFCVSKPHENNGLTII